MRENKAWKYCVVGNIVKERIDENGVLRHGTVAFKGGTRVYIEGKNYDYDYVRDGITVLGLNRHRRYAYEFVPKDQIENVRFTRTFKPTIMEMMYKYEGHDGWWGNSDEDGLDAKQFALNWPQFREMKDYYRHFHRMCTMRNIPDHDLCRYLDQLLGQPEDRKQELAKHFAEETRDRYPMRKNRIHLLKYSDLGNYPADAELLAAMKDGRLAEAEEAAAEDVSDGCDCPRELMDRYIERLVEICGFDRSEMDLIGSYTLLETEADGDPDMMPCGIGVIPFMEAWNDYVRENWRGDKVMFTWDQFVELPDYERKMLIHDWEIHAGEPSKGMGAQGFWEEDDEEVLSRMWRKYEMYSWLRENASPYARELETGNALIEEYRKTGHIKNCPVCGESRVLTYGYAGPSNVWLTIICPTCGVIGHCRGPRSMIDKADRETIVDP